LYVQKVKLSLAVFLAHAKTLESSNAKYPLRRVVCKSVTVLQGFYDLTHEKLFSGQLKKRIIIGMVGNDAFSGRKEHNPYNFQHFNLTEISVFADGQNVQNIKALKMNYNNHECTPAPDGCFVTRDWQSIVRNIQIDMRCMHSI